MAGFRIKNHGEVTARSRIAHRPMKPKVPEAVHEASQAQRRSLGRLAKSSDFNADLVLSWDRRILLETVDLGNNMTASGRSERIRWRGPATMRR